METAGDFFERAPARARAQHVACVWSGRSEGGLLPARVLPDGCIDIVWAAGRMPWVAGPDMEAKLEDLPRGPRAGIRFRPGTAPTILGLPASELRDLRLPLADLWPRALVARLAEELEAASTGESRFRALEQAVARRLGGGGQIDRLVDEAVRGILRRVHAGLSGLGRRDTLPGERQLRRRFTRAVGYAPKVFERVMRFQRFLGLTRALRAPLAELALRAGYADQAHLGRDFVRLAGVPPARFLGR